MTDEDEFITSMGVLKDKHPAGFNAVLNGIASEIAEHGNFAPMPEDRPHRCHGTNSADTPTEWLEMETNKNSSHYGRCCIVTTDAYDGGTIIDGIIFCPWCGERLPRLEKSQ